MTEKHLYVLPEDPESCLAAIAAIQGLLGELKKRKGEADVTVVCPNETLIDVAVCIDEKCDVYRELPEDVKLRDWDMFFKFDVELAYKMAQPTQKHITQIFGIQIGSDPKSLPDLAALWPAKAIPAAVYDVCLLPFPSRKRVYEYLSNNFPELTIAPQLGYDITINWQVVQAESAKIVVGVRSFGTYVAASLGRAVIELYPDDRYRQWLSKWNNPRYQMIYGKIENMTPELVFKALEVQCRRILSTVPV
jgi:hypothetical protein